MTDNAGKFLTDVDAVDECREERDECSELRTNTHKKKKKRKAKKKRDREKEHAEETVNNEIVLLRAGNDDEDGTGRARRRAT